MENQKKYKNEIQEKLKKLFKDFPFEKLIEAGKIIDKEAPEGLLELSNYGWYLGYDSLPKTPVELGRKLKKGNAEDVDEILIKYYEQELDNIEKRLISRNPSRKIILKEAFENHKNKKYYSSITLLLTQVDGLCYDEMDKFYFKNNRKLQRSKIYKPEIEEDITKKKNIILKEFESLLNQPTGVNEHTDNLSKFPIRLNRHEILHGINNDYGTKINSLKIISLLNYINDIVRYKR